MKQKMHKLTLLSKILNIGASESDSKVLRLKKSSFIIVPLMIGLAAFIWGLIYLYFDLFISASIPLSYAVISVYNL